MEKKIAHYPLTKIQTTVQLNGSDAFTRTSLANIDAMELEVADALVVISKLKKSMFVKSMTTYADPRIWQDVYHAPCPNGKVAYIKLTLRDDTVVVVIQFKEK